MTIPVRLDMDRFQLFAGDAAAYQGLLYARERSGGSKGIANDVGARFKDALSACEGARADDQPLNTAVIEDMFHRFVEEANRESERLGAAKIHPEEIFQRLRQTTDSDDMGTVQVVLRRLLQ